MGDDLAKFTEDGIPFDDKACSHLIYAFRIKNGASGLMCTCEQDVCAGCIPNGLCPLYEEMKKRAKEIVDGGTGNGH